MNISLLKYKLPRQLESNPEADGLLELIFLRTRKLYDNSTLSVPVLELTDSLKKSLLTARRTGRAVRGFDNASDLLNLEREGINKLKKQDGQGERISRLVLMANDGADNFYKKAESLLVRHSPRVIGAVLEADSYIIGSLLFGEGKISKFVLIDHKDAVSGIFLSIKGENK